MRSPRERRLRRRADALGYRLRLSRAHIGVRNRGGFRLSDKETGAIIAGECFDLTADQVEELLAKREKELRIDT